MGVLFSFLSAAEINRHLGIGGYISYLRTIKNGPDERKDSRDLLYGLHVT